jgi:O-antigen ligase
MSHPVITTGAPGARWIPAVLGASVATGALIAISPIAALATAGAVGAGLAFSSWPLTLLLLALVARPSLDATALLFTVAGVNLSGMLGVAIVAGGGLALLAGPRHLPGRSVLHVGGAMLLLALVTLTWSLDVDEGFRIWVGYVTPIVVFGLAAWSVRSVAHLQTVVAVVLLSAIVPIVIGLVQLATGVVSTSKGFPAIQGPFIHANGFGFYLMIVVLLGLVAFMETRRTALRVALGIGLALALFCLLNTYARAAWIGLALAVFLLVVLEYRHLVVGIGLGVLVLALAVPTVTTNISERFADLSPSSYASSSFDWRTENWSRMSEYAFDQPLTGHGLGSYLPLSQAEFGVFDYLFREGGKKSQEVYAHNDYLDLAVEIGIPGLLLYIAVFVALIIAAWHARRVPAVRPWATFVVATTAALVVVSGVDNVKGYNAILYVLFAVGGAVVAAAAASSRNRAA